MLPLLDASACLLRLLTVQDVGNVGDSCVLCLQVKLDPRFVSGDTPPLSCRAFLLRLLNNLKQIYITLNMAEEALAIVR